MDCRTARKLINPFIENTLDDRELKSFVDHMNTCSDCKEELSISFLVTEGLSQLESNGSYDLPGRLQEKLHASSVKVRSRRFMLIFMYLCEIAVIIAVIAMGIFLIMR